MTNICLECGKKLEMEELSIGFCADCNAKIENDFHILSEGEDSNFELLSEISS
jgi:hypothetical protein